MARVQLIMTALIPANPARDGLLANASTLRAGQPTGIPVSLGLQNASDQRKRECDAPWSKQAPTLSAMPPLFEQRSVTVDGGP